MVKAVMIQGTSSNAGKSYIATALCRIFKEDGFNVAPFKGWNMALNSWVTPYGEEIGRSQGEQALAAGVKPSADMNPILVKPGGKERAQVIIRGKPWKNVSLQERDDKGYKEYCLNIIQSSLTVLAKEYDVLVMEGAGSPAEINLRQQDLANMAVAKMINSPVILVADVSRGGALAAVVGTLKLLSLEERSLISGIIFNKFRGDLSLFETAVSFIEEYTGVPVLGVIPKLEGIYLAAEDSLSLEDEMVSSKKKSNGEIKIAVLRLNHISNFTDFDSLSREREVALDYVKPGEILEEYDAVIIPGTKNSLEDLAHLKEKGTDKELKKLAKKGVSIIGICGGYQIMGKKLLDPLGYESTLKSQEGLDLLDVVTTYSAEKCTRLVEAEGTEEFCKAFPGLRGAKISGYEIHMGRTERGSNTLPILSIKGKNAKSTFDGALTLDGKVWGTYLHGIFDNPSFRREYINFLKNIKGLVFVDRANITDCEQGDNFQDLATALRQHLNMEKLYKILHGSRCSL